MQIKGINSAMPTMPNVKTQGISKSDDGAFKDFYDAAVGMVKNTSDLQKTADKLTTDFISGKDVSMHSLVIAQEKASIALQFTTQVRNKVVEAYKEIMRMPV